MRITEDLYESIENVVKSYFDSDSWGNIVKSIPDGCQRGFWSKTGKATGFASKDKKGLGGLVLFGSDRKLNGQDYNKLLSIDINNIEVAEHYISTFDACIGAIYFNGKHKIFAVDFEKVIGYFDIITDNYDYYLRVDDQGDTLRVEKVFEDDYTALRSKKTKRGMK